MTDSREEELDSLCSSAGEEQSPGSEQRLARASNSSSSAPGISTAIRGRLYTSHFLSTWNTRGFEFGAVLFLATIYPGTLLPMSIYALIRSLSAILFSPLVGQFIDARDRLEVVRFSIVVQRGAVVLSCLLFWLLQRYRESISTALNYLMMAFLVFFACIEKLCSIMNMIAVERDWVVVIGKGDERTLRVLNSQMRRIDLFCKILSPLAIALIDGLSSQLAIMTTLVINAVSMSVEYALIATVFRRIPDLAKGRDRSQQPSTAAGPGRKTFGPRVVTHVKSFGTSLAEYAQHPTFLPSFSLCLLYFTVLSFAGQMTTYLLAIGLSSTTIGFLRTVSTAFELSSTFIAPYLMSRVGAIRAGIWAQSWLIVTLTCVVGTLWLIPTPDSASTTPSGVPLTSTIAFVSFVILSRIGTWSFDLCAQLIIQDEIEASQRGSFSSTEVSVRNTFELCRFAATIIFSRPQQFKYPAVMTLVAVYVSGGFYAKFVRDRRGHLLHLDRCLGMGVKGRGGRGRYEALDVDADDIDGMELSGRRDRVERGSDSRFKDGSHT